MTCTNCDDGICTNNCQPHGVAATKGHLSSNGVFPWIVMQRGDRIGVLTPSGWFRWHPKCTWKDAELIARHMKSCDIKHHYDWPFAGNASWEYIRSNPNG